MNSAILPPRDQFILREVAFDDLLVDKFYSVLFESGHSYVGKVISKEGDIVTVHFIDDDEEDNMIIHRNQTNGTGVPRYVFRAPEQRGGRRRRTRNTRRRRTTRRRRA